VWCIVHGKLDSLIPHTNGFIALKLTLLTMHWIFDFVDHAMTGVLIDESWLDFT
jgi:hypothetical protein